MAVTTTTYAHDNAALAKYGRWSSSGATLQSKSFSAHIWFRFYGSKLELQASVSYTAAITQRVQIDGGSWTDVAFTGTNAYVELWSGTEGWHDVRLQSEGAVLFVDKAAAVRVTGTDGNQQLVGHPQSGPYERILEAPFSTYGEHTMMTSKTDEGYTNPARPEMITTGVGGGENICVRRKAQWVPGSKIMAYMYTYRFPPDMCLIIDNVHYGTFNEKTSYDSNTTYNRGFLVADLPPLAAGSHEIQLMSSTGGIDGIMITDGVGGSGAYFENVAVEPRTEIVLSGGDSQTAAAGANELNTFSYDALYSLNTKCKIINQGISGSKIKSVSPVSSDLLQRFATLITPHNPSYLLLHPGYNHAVSPDLENLISGYKELLDLTIVQLPNVKRIFCMLISMWVNPSVQTEVNNRITQAVTEWTAANPAWASKVTILTQTATFTATSTTTPGPTTLHYANNHTSAIGYAQMHGDSTGVIVFNGQPSDGDTITMASRGVTKVFEFDNNASVTGSNIAVTIGADATATNWNLFLAIVAQWEAGWKGKPLVRVNDGLTVGCAVSRLGAISKSGTNIAVAGPFRDGVSSEIQAYLERWPTPVWTNISGETGDSLSLGVMDLSHNGRKFRDVGTNIVQPTNSNTAKITVNP